MTIVVALRRPGDDSSVTTESSGASPANSACRSSGIDVMALASAILPSGSARTNRNVRPLVKLSRRTQIDRPSAAKLASRAVAGRSLIQIWERDHTVHTRRDGPHSAHPGTAQRASRPERWPPCRPRFEPRAPVRRCRRAPSRSARVIITTDHSSSLAPSRWNADDESAAIRGPPQDTVVGAEVHPFARPVAGSTIVTPMPPPAPSSVAKRPSGPHAEVRTSVTPQVGTSRPPDAGLEGRTGRPDDHHHPRTWA